MTLEEENEHLRRANMALQRRLERARRDALLYAAQLCEEHYLSHTGQLKQAHDGIKVHHGQMYAAKLREIAK